MNGKVKLVFVKMLAPASAVITVFVLHRLCAEIHYDNKKSYERKRTSIDNNFSYFFTYTR